MAEKKGRELPGLDALPQPSSGAQFRLLHIERVSLPHPYCITPKHVVFASDHRGGILDREAIRGAEKVGAECDICKKGARRGRPVLSIDEHTEQVSLFVEVPQNHDLNAVPGLHAYLVSIKDKAVALGIEGFAFPVGAVSK